VVIVYRRLGTTCRVPFGLFTREDGTDTLSRNVGKKNYHTTQRNIPEERRYHQHHGCSLKSRLQISRLTKILFSFSESSNNPRQREPNCTTSCFSLLFELKTSPQHMEDTRTEVLKQMTKHLLMSPEISCRCFSF
jgi:hypothetical protein